MLWFFVSCAFVSEDNFSKRMDPDGDGYSIEEDCDSTKALIGEAQEWFFDEDGDGYGDASISDFFCSTPEEGWVLSDSDCDDSNPEINRVAIEICDGVDNNCDDEIDDVLTDAGQDVGGTLYYLDSDDDGYGDDGQVVQACSPVEGYVEASGDCDDTLSRTYPDAPELCDNLDNDCDGSIDNDAEIPMYLDLDGDGYTESLEPEYLCPSFLQEGYIEEAQNFVDCNDADSSIFPSQEEICDGIDNNCNNIVDEGLVASIYIDGDDDGYGSANIVQQCINPDGSAPEGYALMSGDCDDSDFLVSPAAEEFCDGIDNNCDTQVDEGVQVTYFTDTDGDGYGDPQDSFQSCPNTQYTVQSGDCNDTDTTVYPGAPELCDGLDNNCNGNVSAIESDVDGDGYVVCSIDTGGWDGDSLVVGGDDCDDQSMMTYPGAAYYDSTIACIADEDGDGYGNDADGGTDCDDGNSSINPGIAEIPIDGIDQNCDGMEACPADGDGDGYENITNPVNSTNFNCSLPVELDCDDDEYEIYPGATEFSGTTDYNCDGMEYTDDTCFSIDVDGVYFLMCSGNTSWSSAYGRCNSAGYDFASIQDSNENQELTSRVGSKGAWIGFYDTDGSISSCGPTNMNFQWADGQSGSYVVSHSPFNNCVPIISAGSYTSWQEDEPNNSEGTEGCVQVSVTGYWNDSDCTRTNPYICELR